jgi:NADH dehydrogenase (ubiquinone) Fe-S protein 3
MATRMYRSRALAGLRPARAVEARCFSTTVPQLAGLPVGQPKDAQRLRNVDRQAPGELRAPIVNPADKYATASDNLHKYGAWVMGCLPKYVQQFSVWKDELTIYIPPSGVIPVFSFLKCRHQLAPRFMRKC